MEIVETIISLVGGGSLVAMFTLPSAIRKAKAEARSADIENMEKTVEGWKRLAEERQDENKELLARIADLTAQIDARYVDIGQWRDKCAQQQERITELEISNAKNEVKVCVVRNCERRDPPSGY